MNNNQINSHVNSQLTAVIGAFWGDEGKGKITKAIGSNADVVVRFNGGPNAGHTIYHHNKKIIMRQIPSIIKKNIVYLIGHATLINPQVIFKEYQLLKEINQNEIDLKISPKCHIILPYHIILDEILEELRGKDKINTTKCGVGPCLTDKIRRCGIRVGDLWNLELLENKINLALKLAKPFFDVANRTMPTATKIIKDNQNYFDFLKSKKATIEWHLHHAIKNKKQIMFEAAQGCMLDLNHGTYPYVTSSSTVCTAISNNIGYEINQPINTIGCSKLYATRVGKGPFPTEVSGELQNFLQEKGNEFGSVSGTGRRTGWLDLVILKYAQKINHFNCLAITKVDILSDLPEIKICTGYNINKEKKYWDYAPSTTEGFAKINPQYKTFKGYHLDPNKNYQTFDELPENLKIILQYIEKESEIPIKIISYGPNDHETIYC